MTTLQILSAIRSLAEYFETTARLSLNPKMAANWILGELTARAEQFWQVRERKPDDGGRPGRAD